MTIKELFELCIHLHGTVEVLGMDPLSKKRIYFNGSLESMPENIKNMHIENYEIYAHHNDTAINDRDTVEFVIKLKN